MIPKESINLIMKAALQLVIPIHKCSNCQQNAEIISMCICNSRFYCCNVCEIEDNIHRKNCKDYKIHKNKPRAGIVGLVNLGNTCYLNSCLQCLSHTKLLRTYFLEKYYVNEIQNYSKQFSKSFAGVLENLWLQTQESYSPKQFQKVLAKYQKQFSGTEQHDVLETYSVIVELLHSELKRTQKTKILERGKEAKQIWAKYMQGNQSIITDLMTGQSKSEITCKICEKKTQKYETFRYLSLPIPDLNPKNKLKFFVLYKNFTKPIEIYEINCLEMNGQRIFEQAANKVGLEKQSCTMYFLTKTCEVECLMKVKNAEIEEKIKTFKLFLIEYTAQQEHNSVKDPFACSFVEKCNTSLEIIWLKKPYFIDLENETGQSFKRRVLKFLYSQIYKFKEEKTLWDVKGNSYEKYEELMLTFESFKLKLAQTKRRKCTIGNTSVAFDREIVLQDQLLIKDSMKKMEDLIPDQYYEPAHYQIIVMVNEEMRKHFDFQKLTNPQEGKQFGDKYKVTLEDCLDKYLLPEHLDDKTIRCSKCGGFNDVTKKMSIYKTPEILIFSLNRFKFKNQKTGLEKNDKPVKFPTILNMQKYVEDQSPICSYNQFAKSQNIYIKPPFELEICEQNNQNYELYGLICHSGADIKEGHYKAYAKNDTQWYKFNDAIVYQTDLSKVKLQKVYMLFYQRKKMK